MGATTGDRKMRIVISFMPLFPIEITSPTMHVLNLFLGLHCITHHNCLRQTARNDAWHVDIKLLRAFLPCIQPPSPDEFLAVTDNEGEDHWPD